MKGEGGGHGVVEIVGFQTCHNDEKERKGGGKKKTNQRKKRKGTSGVPRVANGGQNRTPERGRRGKKEEKRPGEKKGVAECRSHVGF